MKHELRCQHCGDLIGVYEPLVRLADGHPHETSRAAHPNPGDCGVPCFHRSCYEQVGASQQAR